MVSFLKETCTIPVVNINQESPMPYKIRKILKYISCLMRIEYLCAVCLRRDIIYPSSFLFMLIFWCLSKQSFQFSWQFGKESETWTTSYPLNYMSEDVSEILVGDVCLQILPDRFHVPLCQIKNYSYGPYQSFIVMKSLFAYFSVIKLCQRRVRWVLKKSG